MPTQSAVLPASTGKISYVRIMKVEISLDKARYLFEMNKEKVA